MNTIHRFFNTCTAILALALGLYWVTPVAAANNGSVGLLWGNSASFIPSPPIEGFNKDTGELVKHFPRTPGNGRAIVVVGNTIYYTLTGDGKIYKMDATTGADAGFIQTELASMSTLAWDGGTFWTSDYAGTARAFQIDPATGKTIKTITLGTGTNKDGMEFFNGKLIANRGDAPSPGIYDIYDLDGNLLQEAFITNDKASNGVQDMPSTGIAYDGVNFYVSNIMNNSISVFDGTTGKFIKIITLGTPAGEYSRLIEDLSVDYAQRPDTSIGFSKTATPDPVPSGGNLTYTLCYDNLAGVNQRTLVTIKDSIPEGTTFISATGTYTLSEGMVTWNIGTVAAKADKICYDLVVKVTAPADSVISNSAIINSTETGEITHKIDTAVGEPAPEPIPTATTQNYTLSGKGGGGSFGLFEVMFGLAAAAFTFLVRRQRVAAVAVMGGLAVTAVMMASPVQAGWYAGVGGGLTRGDFSSSTLESHLIAKGYNTPPNAITSVSVDNTDSGWKIFGGYQFNRFLAAEVSRVNLGDTKSTVTGSLTTPPSDIPTLLNDASDAHGYLARGWTVAGVGIWPVKPTVSLFAKLGVFRWKADINITEISTGQSVSRDENGGNAMGGIGIKHMPNPKWELRAEIERYKVSSDWVDFLSLGVGYRF